MDKKIKIILALVIVFGVITSVGTYLYLDRFRRGQEEQIENNKMQVVFMKEDIAADTVIQEDMLEVRRVDKSLAIPDKVITKKEEAVGKYSQNVIYGGEIVRKEELVDADLHNAHVEKTIENGMRAISVPVESDSGVAGLLYPGSYVDVIFTYTEGSTQQANLLLENKKILALDKISSAERIMYDVVADANNETSYQTATLEVTPSETVRLALAMKLGEIRLVLRPQHDQSINENKTDLNAILGVSE